MDICPRFEDPAAPTAGRRAQNARTAAVMLADWSGPARHLVINAMAITEDLHGVRTVGVDRAGEVGVVLFGAGPAVGCAEFGTTFRLATDGVPVIGCTATPATRRRTVRPWTWVLTWAFIGTAKLGDVRVGATEPGRACPGGDRAG